MATIEAMAIALAVTLDYIRHSISKLALTSHKHIYFIINNIQNTLPIKCQAIYRDQPDWMQ